MDEKNKIRLLKIWEILNRESDEEHPLRTEEIIRKLAEDGIPCHRKTLYEDVKILNANGYEVFVNRSTSNEYYVIDRTFDVPELQILMDAVLASKSITQAKSEQLVKKIANLAGTQKGEVLKRNIVAFNTAKSNNEKVFYTINEIALALEKKQQVAFYYFKYNEKREKVYQRKHNLYVVNPLATVFCDDKYYLMCYDDKHGNVIHYRIDRMEGLRMTDEPIKETEESKKFDIKKHKNQLFGMYVGAPKKVTLEVDKSAVDGIYDKFGDSVKPNEVGDKLIFEVEAQISPTFIAWIMGFGKNIRVVAPKDVVKKVKERLKEALSMY
ncbi:MAG: WYL domain-containing protein [Clostridia bacterium]|nr:WYL domain-containing protein [Clostridia bacterium]